MSGFTRALYSPRGFDALFTIVGLANLYFLIFTSGHGADAIAPTDYPIRTGATAVGCLLAGGLVASQTTRLDQRLADDFVFQTLSKASMIGMMTLIFSATFWQVLFVQSLGEFTSFLTLQLAIGGLTFGYFYTRLTGTRA